MRRRLLFFGLFGVLALIGVLGAVSGGSAATPGSNPFYTSLTDGHVSSVSCPAAGNCAAGGEYRDSFTNDTQAFVVDEAEGVWGHAVAVPGLAALNTGGHASVNSVSCATAGNCAAGGQYKGVYHRGFGHKHAFVVDERHGVWGKAIEVPGKYGAEVDSVSCAAPGDCAAGGSYGVSHGDVFGYTQPFVMSETNGVWGKAIEVPGIAALNKGFGALESISCGAPGDCAAGGYYNDGLDVVDSFGIRAFVVTETNGVWGKAVEVPGTAALNNTGGDAFVSSVSCATAGNCAVGGSYTDGVGGIYPFVVSETNNVWGVPVEVDTGELDTGGWGDLYSISCASPGECAAGGSSAGEQAFVVSETNGVWGKAIGVPSIGGWLPYVGSVSCPAAGDCAAGGVGEIGSGHNQAFVVSETNGVWGDAVEVPGTGAPHLDSVSCGAVGDCAGGGSYSVGPGPDSQAFVVNETNGVWGDPNELVGPPPPVTRTCNGTYSGTGANVVVPAYATCTLSGTRLSGNITVRDTGNLNLDDVTVGGNVTILGGVTTVCNSKIAGNVHATEGSFVLGTANCGGNTISGSVVVQYEPYRLRVLGNTIGGNLTVNGATGRKDSIVDNSVAGSLLVEHSGSPVEVSGNDADTARCVDNKGQTGSGNSAERKNTCPS